MKKKDTSATASLNTLFKEIRSATEALNAAADRANAYIRQVNDELKSSGAGMAIWMEPDEPFFKTEWTGNPPNEEEGGAWYYLGYAKIDREWGLAVRYEIWVNDEHHHTEGPELLARADRQTRIQAIPAIPILLKRVAEELYDEARKIDASLSESGEDAKPTFSPRQRELMRSLVERHGSNEDTVVREYAEAERRGEVKRRSDVNNVSPEKYARRLWADGVARGWLTP